MRCAKCGADNREGRKFCTQCGSPLEAKCPRCGAAIEPAEKFCGECGTGVGTPLGATGKSEDPQIRIAGAPAPENLEGERKTVTALFADIRGSMDLIEDLDPEEARAIVDPALKLMIEAVQRYGGYVAQSTGDGIFGLFGAPVAHEDHPQRALLAALRMQAEVKRYADKLRAEKGVNFQVRVGANTGEVVVREIRTGEKHTEYLPIGHSTSLAARLQGLATPGSIAISDALRKLVEGYFALKPLGPARIKGVSEPLEIYEVTGLGPLRTRLQRGAARGYTKFVGRHREMEALQHAAELAQAGHGQIVAAVAEPGVGKSRLFFEFKATSQSEWLVFEAFSVSHSKASSYLPVLDLLHTYFRVTLDDDARSRREKVAGKIRVLDRSLEDTLPYLFALLGIVEGEDVLAQMDAQVKKRRTLDAIKRILLRESLNQPLIVMFEDLHWIDEETQALLNLLADSIGNARILLLVNYRPEYSHAWGSKTYYTQLRLDPLAEDSFEDLMSSLLGDSEEQIPIKRLIFEKTEGNPFYIEEIFEMLLGEGALVRNGGIKLAKPLAELKIPPTVRDILASRIDRLPREEKELLQILAVAGKEFPLSIAQEVSKKPDDELNSMLSDLQLAEFIYEQPSTGDVEFTFKHALTQEVAYSSILSDRRRGLHDRIGAAIETVFADRLDESSSEIARHYRRSGNAPKAIEYLQRAGLRACRRSVHAEAVAHYNAALELIQSLPKSRERDELELLLQTGLALPLGSLRGWGSVEYERVCERRRLLAEEVGDTSELCRVIFGLAAIASARAEFRKAEELALAGLERAERAGDRELLIEAYHMLMAPTLFQGKFARCQKLGDELEALYDADSARSYVLTYGDDPVVCAIGYEAYAQWSMGYPDRALQTIRKIEAIARELKHPFSEAVYFIRAFLVLDALGRDGEASALFDRMASLCEEKGFAEMGAVATAGQAENLVRKGEDSLGIELLRTHVAASRALNHTSLTFVLIRLAKACGDHGQTESAFEYVNDALDRIAKTGGRAFEAEAWRLKGEMLHKLSRYDEANQCFQDALRVAREQEAKSFELRATTSLARLLRETNRRDEARAMLSQIYNWFTEGFDTADLKDAKALLDEPSR
jgi:class 3 adenylate cyclase/tetratricopeptide (TPR) repeat protein